MLEFQSRIFELFGFHLESFYFIKHLFSVFLEYKNLSIKMLGFASFDKKIGKAKKRRKTEISIFNLYSKFIKFFIINYSDSGG